MKVAVAGLWHLGTVTAACLAGAGYEVTAYDDNAETIADLQKNQAPLFEPGLNELIAQGANAGKLKFTTHLPDIADAEILWVTFDTPVDENDQADIDYVINHVKACFPYLSTNAIVLISSQLPVGSIKKLEELYKKEFPNKPVSFACSPENLRLGKAIEIFTKPDRIVVGVSSENDKVRLGKFLAPFSDNIVWMSVVSAEMTKHALNAFLATSVVFINELATLCESVGADAREVERGLKSEVRIGPRAYLKPGAAFAGGTLARDIAYLIQLGDKKTLPTKLFSAVLESNQLHKEWSQRRLNETLGELTGKTIAVLGLTYKPGTDTLRRSTSVETCRWLNQQGAIVVAHDPAVKHLPAELNSIIQLKPSINDALKNADAAIVSTEWPEFTVLTSDDLINHLRRPILFDPNGFLAKKLSGDDRIKYFTVGK